MPVHHVNPTVDDVLSGHDGATETIKLLAFHHQHSAVELLDLIPPIIGTDLVVSHMGTEAVELGPVGADKGAGLRWLSAHLEIDAADVLVFGDEINDLAMFDFAGRSVAVANASANCARRRRRGDRLERRRRSRQGDRVPACRVSGGRWMRRARCR